MPIQFTNDATTFLAANINAATTSITVVDASSFPTLGVDDYTYVTLAPMDNATREIVKCTAITGNTLTVVRAQEGTTAASFTTEDRAQIRITAQLFRDIMLAYSSLDSYRYIATANQTIFSGPDTLSATLAYLQNNIIVLLNGVVLGANDYTATDGATVELGVGASVGDELTIVAFTAFELADTYNTAQIDAMVANFSLTGIDDNATSTAITIDASENVLVGKTSGGTGTQGVELNPTSAAGYTLAATSSGQRTVLFNRLSSDGEIISLRKDGTSVGSIKSDSGSIMLGSGDVGVYFDAASDRVLPVNITTGYVRNDAIDIGGNPHRFKDLYLSGGVYLGGTSNTSSLSNKLDDYEEGTWTPVLKFDGNNVGMVFTGQAGFYTKVGNLVTANSYYSLSDKGSSNGAAQIHGLPFAVANVTSNYIPVSLGFSGVNFADMMIGYTLPNTTYVNLREVSNAGAHTTIVQSNVANSGDMMMSVTYRTA